MDNPEYPIAKWANILQIERSGYYAWLRRREHLEQREVTLKEKIKDRFNQSRGTYGPKRITEDLRKEGEHLGRKSCEQYMKEKNLVSIHNRHRTKSLTNSKKERGEGYVNILRDQEFPIVPRRGVPSVIT
jgi:putative transposase